MLQVIFSLCISPFVQILLFDTIISNIIEHLLYLSHYARCTEKYENESDLSPSLESLETNRKYAHKLSNYSEKMNIGGCSKMIWAEAWVSFMVTQGWE